MSMTYIIFIIIQYDVIFIKEKEDYDMPTQIAATPIIRGTEAHKILSESKNSAKKLTQMFEKMVN